MVRLEPETTNTTTEDDDNDNCDDNTNETPVVSLTNPPPADQILLQWLCTNIARDGGATLVTSLKDHYWLSSPKRLNDLLVQSSIGKAKLLRFLEAYSPSIFQVDRHVIPHWVILTDPTPANVHIREDEYQVVMEPTKAVERLHQKVLYVLRRRQARLDRRGQLDRYNHPESFKVNSSWLVKESPWELHFYLRALDLYRKEIYAKTFDDNMNGDLHLPRTVHPVMSQGWQDLVVSILERFLQEQYSQDFAVDQTHHRVWLRTMSSGGLEGNVIPSPDGVRRPVASSTPPDWDEPWLENLMPSLVQLVKNDGATRVALGLLLHRHDSLKASLGGRDLWHMYRQFPDCFTRSDGVLQVLKRSTTCDIYLEWKPSGNMTIEDEIAHHSSAKPGRCSSKAGHARMKVDAVGLFSVTNSRCASAFANIMIQSCQRVGWNVEEMTAIDMTASVGGMTLGLARAKRSFCQILAMEIDETRARLCEENMKDHGIHNVKVINTDSVAAISTFPDQCCIVIDPPWGGEHYKEFKDHPPLELGPWKLEDVILKISKQVSACVVGLRLPVTLNVDAFLEDRLATTRGLQFERLTVRKLNVQLLVVLKIDGVQQN
jgi:predicted RNA methylase